MDQWIQGISITKSAAREHLRLQSRIQAGAGSRKHLMYHLMYTRWGPRYSQVVYRVYGRYIPLTNGGYKPTNMTFGGSNLVWMMFRSMIFFPTIQVLEKDHPSSMRYPLVICYIAIENCPFIVDLPIKDGDFP